MKSGIYIIKCLINRKVYVGKSREIVHRWHDHKHKLRRGIHPNNHLQSAWTKYSEKAFVFGVVEHTVHEELEKAELKWILQMNATDKEQGFNKCYKGQIITKNHNESNAHLGRGLTRRTILAIHLESGNIREFTSGREAAGALNIPYKGVSNSMSYWNPNCKLKTSKKSKGGYAFVPKEFYDPKLNYQSYIKVGKLAPFKGVVSPPSHL